MEMILSRKRPKSQTRSRKLHSTEASQDPRRLERELKACRRKIAHALERLAEVSEREAAGVVGCKHPAVGRRVLILLGKVARREAS
jgi:hypothetical protein